MNCDYVRQFYGVPAESSHEGLDFVNEFDLPAMEAASQPPKS